MPSLTISQVAEIAKELAETDDKITQAEESVAQTAEDKAELLRKNNMIKVFYDTTNNTINAYQRERRWLNGFTHTEIPFSDIDAAARRTSGNIFFPAEWMQFAPFMAAKINGLPTSTSPNSELNIITRSLDDSGVNALIDFLINGQSSGVSSTTLTEPYSPGATQIEVFSGGQTSGNLLQITGSSTSALVRVTSVSGTTVNISEIVPPENTISDMGSQVVENIPSFDNTTRNTLSGGSRENILLTLTSRLETSISLWKTALSNQLTQLTANGDDIRSAQISSAQTAASEAVSAIDTWQALPDTGTDGTDSKYTDNNLEDITDETATRIAFIPTRSTQIVRALGTATQDSRGNIGGSGLFRDRFERISLMINTTDGPLFQFYSSDSAQNAAQQNIRNTKQKAKTFASGIFTSILTENATGSNDVTVKDGGKFSIGDSVVITAPGLDDIVAEVNAVAGNQLTLSKVIAATYTTEANASVSKSR
jgi:hypothetical protein